MDATQALEKWVLAERANDIASLEVLLADDFAGIGPKGYQLDKQQWLDRFRSGKYRNQSFDWSDTDGRQYGPTTVVRGVLENSGVYEDLAVHSRCRGTLVFVDQDGAVRLAALQLSDITQPPQAGAAR